VKMGAAVTGDFDGELCAALPQLAQPPTTRMPAASAHLIRIRLKFDMALISAFALSVYSRANGAQNVRDWRVEARGGLVRRGLGSRYPTLRQKKAKDGAPDS